MSWLDVILILSTLLVICFAGVLLVGAPYVPTLTRQIDAAVRYIESQTTGQPAATHILELGSGDGVVMRSLARHGFTVTGYELNPILWLVSWFRLRSWRLLTKVHLGNFWSADISQADYIFVFLYPKFMDRLDKKITQEARKNVKLISFAFKIPDKKPVKIVDGLYIYDYQPRG